MKRSQATEKSEDCLAEISLEAGSFAGSLGFSLRRHYVDDFHLRHVLALPAGSHVLDLAGNRIGKRGVFDIENYGLDVLYANLSVAKRPDIQAYAECLPFREGFFDAVICSEMIEHVMNPLQVLEEIQRVLKPNGVLLISVPFLNRIHGDPYDYGRYTDFFWAGTLERMGFSGIIIEKQGLFWSVIVDMFRDFLYVKASNFKSGILVSLLGAMVSVAKTAAVRWDYSEVVRRNPVLSGYTSGFGIKAIKI
ncbi:MAG: class I SAM-dependent methyltransferase [Desulfomonile tiedjei]|uniref:Class I SAM-dependent methyltransferase n=1 Tax=Desulfomonile tiedjei TaxID=2358 RepID=A0A9D6V1V6_9BACT|nr:class I SAM-dependent methyltransferase [Desulfomonile tiedjei]